MRDKGHNFLRVYRIIEYVAAAPRPVSYAEISDELALPKPTTHRLCELLIEQAILQRDPDGRCFIPGQRLRTLALEVLGGNGLAAERRLVLQSLSRRTGETCNLTVPDGTSVLYLDRVETEWPLRIAFPVGSRVPLHCTASGKLYLSQMATRERRRLLAALELEPSTRNTIIDADRLAEELAVTRERQYGIDNEEFLDGMIAVAVPVHDPQGRICATIAIHGPVQRFTLDRALSHLPLMRDAAASLEATLRSGA